MKYKPILLEIRKTITVIFVFMLVLCVVYPFLVWGFGQVLFPWRANGSLIQTGVPVTGSQLIGQSFSRARYFFPRPSAAGRGYDPLVSGGSNLGPLSATLFQQVSQRVRQYRQENGLPATVLVPVDAVTASGSGLDPHISVENARLQAGRIARVRGVKVERVLALITRCMEGRQLGIFGEKRVNVLLLNLELEKNLKEIQ